MSSPRGMTLIEICIALAIAVLLFSAAVIGFNSITGASAKQAAGELGGVIRSLYDTAALSGKTCRLVFDLPKVENKEESSAIGYHAECASGNITTELERDETLKAATKKRDKAEEDEDGRDAFKLADAHGMSGDATTGGPTFNDIMVQEKVHVDDSSKYSGFSSPLFETKKFPDSVKLDIWTTHQRQPVTAGVAYLYFFPQGFTEKAMIHLRQGDNVWTLTVSPLTGQTKVVPEYLEVPKT